MKNQKVLRICGDAEKLIRLTREPKESLREYPTYSIPEAALFIGMHQRTLRRWVYDKPFFEVCGVEYSHYLLSFKDLAQYYFLQFIRKNMGLSDRQARDILAFAKILTRSRYPLLHKDIKALFGRVLLDQPGRHGKPRLITNLSQPHRGQYEIDEVVDLFATRITRDSRGHMIALYPWRLWKEGDERKPVVIDPHVMSGRLVITGTRIPVQAVAARQKAGESVRDIAADYKLTQQIVKQSLRHIGGLRKAA